MTTALPVPAPGPDAAVAWVAAHLGHLVLEGADRVVASPRFRGTQASADAALDSTPVAGYAGRRNHVLPVSRRGATALSPWIRHGLLSLPAVWESVGGRGAPAGDVRKLRDELLWQEYARHLYARLGPRTGRALRHEPPATGDPSRWPDPWPREMECMAFVLDELEGDGWLVNQTRMWMASQWTVRAGAAWEEGEDRFFTHLLDGSRAANRLGWQWSVGTGTGRPYGFSRWQVQKRAPELCGRCRLAERCPIGSWPAPKGADGGGASLPEPSALRRDDDPAATAGPVEVEQRGTPQVVWLTAESLGDADPALAAHDGLPVVFVFDEPLLGRLRLSAKRLVFLTERLGELAGERDVEVHLGAPADVLAGRAAAVTWAPVPGFGRIERALGDAVAERHPWPWLRRPGPGSLRSFSAWRR